MKTRCLIQAQTRATVEMTPTPDDASGCDMSTHSTADGRPRVVSRRTLDVLGRALCLITLALASGWMLGQAGIGEIVYPLRVATSGNSDLNALLIAIELNDVPAARRVLRKQRLDVNTADDAGVPPINYALRACGASATELADLLIAAGADVNGRGTDGFATLPLMDAATLGRPDLVERLLRAGADVGASHRNGWTALHSAAMCDDRETVAVLLAAGADPDAADDEGDTPLTVAVKNKCAGTAALLAHRGPPAAREGQDLALDP
jgi:hypothetical protein